MQCGAEKIFLQKKLGVANFLSGENVHQEYCQT
jgi:hypothetical protein